MHLEGGLPTFPKHGDDHRRTQKEKGMWKWNSKSTAKMNLSLFLIICGVHLVEAQDITQTRHYTKQQVPGVRSWTRPTGGCYDVKYQTNKLGTSAASGAYSTLAASNRISARAAARSKLTSSKTSKNGCLGRFPLGKKVQV